MSDRKDFLEGYVEVKDRIAAFYELFANGRLVTDQVEVLTAPDGKQRVMVKGLAYRTPDDPHPAVGYSWMELPGTTNYTRGSELENTETSAIGRAIGFLGILVDKSIASANEIRAKAGDAEQETPARDGIIGTAEKTDKRTGDYALRQTPDGSWLGFRLKEGRGGQLLEAHGPMADALAAVEAQVIGKRVQVWGHFIKRTLTNGGSYQAFVIERIATPDFILPAEAIDTRPSVEPEAAGVASSEPTAQPSASTLFSPDEDAALDAALDAA